ncbi:Min [Salmonella sp. NCTC 11881]|nr:Min [Salmonella sp. NCTC 11881]
MQKNGRKWHDPSLFARGPVVQIGYVRVSTNDQNTDLQRNALNCAGCELIFEDKISGTKSERPGLKKVAQDVIRRGHTGCMEA